MSKLKIWYQELDDEGKVVGAGVYPKEYCYWGTAMNVARKLYGDKENIRYEISVLNPFEEHFADVVCEICGKTYATHVTNGGYVRFDNGVHMHSRDAIPPRENRHRRYSQGYSTCPDCIVKIKNFVDSLKEGKDDENTDSV